MFGEREEAERKKEAPTEKSASVAGEVSRRWCARRAVLVERGLAALQSYCSYIYWRTQKKRYNACREGTRRRNRYATKKTSPEERAGNENKLQGEEEAPLIYPFKVGRALHKPTSPSCNHGAHIIRKNKARARVNVAAN